MIKSDIDKMFEELEREIPAPTNHELSMERRSYGISISKKGVKRPDHSATLRGRKHTKERSQNISNAMKGVKKSEEHNKANSEGQKRIRDSMTTEEQKKHYGSRGAKCKGHVKPKTKCDTCGEMIHNHIMPKHKKKCN